MIVKNYCEGLTPVLKEQYLKKLSQLDNTDPYSKTWGELDKNVDKLPKVTHDMLMDFLIFRLSPETQKEIRAYKSLEGWVQFACKWITDIRFYKVGTSFVTVGKVMHSQRVNDPPLCPWILQSQSGELCETHCNCVAGFSRVCIHVASVLFALEYASRNAQPNQSVTDVLAYWIGPAKKRGDFQKSLAEIDFRNPKRKLECSSDEELSAVSTSSDEEIPSTSKEEVITFLQKCKDEKQQVALFSVVEGFAESTLVKNPLLALYKPEYEQLNITELRRMASDLNISISAAECETIERVTRKQSKSKEWFHHRSGRITASIFKSVCRTNIEKPSMTLVRSICYPATHRPVFRATEYGCRHEKVALQKYLEEHRKRHPDAALKETGLIIHPNFPMFGASPDSILVCQACDTNACVEVKCPFCAKDTTIRDWAMWKKTCLITKGNNLELDPNHSYYFQCQMQMALSGLSVCDFVVWTKDDLFLQRIHHNVEHWEEHSNKASRFMQNVILPELLAKYYTKKAAKEAIAQAEEDRNLGVDEPVPGPSGIQQTK